MGNDLEYWVNYFEKFKPEILPDNYNNIKEHIRKIKTAGMSEQTIVNHYQALSQFGKWCKKPFVKINESDILDFRDWLEIQTFTPRCTVNKPKKVNEKHYSEGTIYMKLATVKAFLKNINPSAAGIIRVKPKSKKKLPEDILNKDEIERLLNNAPNARDRALVATLYESGMRRGEIFSLHIKNIYFDENGCSVTIPKGKTGARRIRLVFAASFLRDWLNVHPLKENREAFVFCSLKEPFGVLSDAGWRDQIMKIAKKANVQKRVNMHSFRHARATHLSRALDGTTAQEILGLD